VISGSLVSAIASIASAIGVLGVALSGMGAIFATILVGVGLVVAGLVAIGKELYNEVNAVRDFREEIAELNKEAKSSTVSSLTQQIADLNKEIEKQQKIKEMQWFDPYAIQEADKQIEKFRNQIINLQKISEKVNPIAGFSTTPVGLDNDSKEREKAAAKAKRLHDQWIADEVQYYDKIRALEKEDRIAGIKVRNWWSTNETDKLMDMKAAFASRIEEFKLFGVSYINKEKEFNSKVAQLRREQVEASEKARNKARQVALIDPAQQLFNDKMAKDAMAFNNIVDKIASQDKLNKINDYSQAMYSSLRDFSQNIYAGFGEMAASAILGGFTFEQAFNQLGNFFLNSVGDLLIQMGNSAIKLGISSEAIKKALAAIGLPEGGFAAIAAGTLAVAAGSMLKGLASKNKQGMTAKQGTTTVTANAGKLSGMASGSSYNYGGASYAAQTVRLSIDLTGAITATQTGYSINKSLETTLRVTGR
jgi:hypothetical protein